MTKFAFSSKQYQKLYDIVISGQGPAGIALALALQKSQQFQEQSILLIDSKELDFIYPKNKIPDQRAVTLNNNSIQLLKSLNIWDKLESQRINFFNKIHICELSGNSIFQQKQDQLGCIVEKKHLIAASLNQLKQQNEIQICQDSILSIKNQKNTLDVETKNGLFKTKLLIGADGPNSFTTKLSKMNQLSWSYDQIGIVCTIKSDHNSSIAYQKFLNDSTISLLPLFNNYYSIVISCNIKKSQEFLNMDQLQFINQLNQIFKRTCKLQSTLINYKNFMKIPQIIELCNQRLYFPLQQQNSRRYINDRVAIMGDQTHQIHHLTGQGINLGYNDMVFLANNIIKHKKVANDYGLQVNLEDYVNHDKTCNNMNNDDLNIYKNNFSFQNTIFSYLRNNTLGLLQNIPRMNNQTIKIAQNEIWHPKLYEWEHL